MNVQNQCRPTRIVIDESLPLKDRQKLITLITSGLPASRLREVEITRISDRISEHHCEQLDEIIDEVADKRGPEFYQIAYADMAFPDVAELTVSQILERIQSPVHFEVQSLAEKICIETGWVLHGGGLLYTGIFFVKIFSVRRPVDV